MNFAEIKGVSIPQGAVKQISIGGTAVWKKQSSDLVFYDWIKGDGVAYIDIYNYVDPEPPANQRDLTIVCRPDTLNGYVFGMHFMVHDDTYGTYEYGSYGCGMYRQAAGTMVKYYSYLNYSDFSSYSSGSKYTITYKGGQPGRVIGLKDGTQVISSTQQKIMIPMVLGCFDFVTYNYTFNQWTHTSNNRDAGYIWSIVYKDRVTGLDLMDLRPCTYNGAAGLWDIVSGTFYGNSNTSGTLTVGND